MSTGSRHPSDTDLRQTDVAHLIKLPLHCLPVPLQLPLGVSQPLQVLLVLLLLTLPLLPVLLQLPLLLLDLLLLQSTRTCVDWFTQPLRKCEMAAALASFSNVPGDADQYFGDLSHRQIETEGPDYIIYT